MNRIFKTLAALIALAGFASPAFSQNRAPAGGMYIDGKFYSGGQFIPNGTTFNGIVKYDIPQAGPSAPMLPAISADKFLAADEQAAQSRAVKRAKLEERAHNRFLKREASGIEVKKVDERIFGKVVGIVDGDTIDIVTESNEKIRIRLAGIDAPEKAQPFGTTAKLALSESVFGKPVMVIKTDNDAFGRTVGKVMASGVDVSRYMVAKGLAWHYTKYSSDAGLAIAEKAARANRLGLWSIPNPVAPWDWRHK